MRRMQGGAWGRLVVGWCTVFWVSLIRGLFIQFGWSGNCSMIMLLWLTIPGFAIYISHFFNYRLESCTEVTLHSLGDSYIDWIMAKTKHLHLVFPSLWKFLWAVDSSPKLDFDQLAFLQELVRGLGDSQDLCSAISQPLFADDVHSTTPTRRITWVQDCLRF